MSAIAARQVSWNAPSAHGNSGFSLEDVNLHVEAGEAVALLGPSGCGKSTLLKLIAGFLIPKHGSIHIGESPVAEGAMFVAPERRQVGLVFQQASLFPHLNVEQNILFGVVEKNKDARRAIAQQWLSAIRLEGRAKQWPHQLSGGEQQRVALARALAARPRALLLDEPFASLDEGLRRELRAECFSLLAGHHISTLLVTHDAEEAFELSQRVYIMDRGRIIQSGAPETLYRTPCSRVAAELTGDVNVLPLSDGTERYLRPEDVQLSLTPVKDAWRGVMQRVLYRGHARLAVVEVEIGKEKRIWRVRLEDEVVPEVGMVVFIKINPL